jgi:hypothetical protein
MNLHLTTCLYIAGFVAVVSLIAFGLNTFPTFTLVVFGCAMFAAFYHLVYSFVKLERTIEELKAK